MPGSAGSIHGHRTPGDIYMIICIPNNDLQPEAGITFYTQKRADIVDIPSVYHLVISPGQGDISSAQGDITFTL